MASHPLQRPRRSGKVMANAAMAANASHDQIDQAPSSIDHCLEMEDIQESQKFVSVVVRPLCPSWFLSLLQPSRGQGVSG